MCARRFPFGAVLLVLTAVALGAVISFASGFFSHGWQTARSFGQTRVALVQERLNDVGGKVLDAASSLAESDLAEVTPTATLIVVLPELPTEAALLASLPITITPAGGLIVAPTTVPEATAIAALGATNPITAAQQTTTTTAIASALAPTTAAPTPTPAPPVTPTQVQPTATQPAPATPTQVQPTATQAPPTIAPSATPLPSPTAAVAAVAAGGTGGELTYTVQPGDDWFKIARRFGITQEALAAFNGQTPSSILQVGQRLRIPSGDAPAPPPTPTPVPTRPKPTATPVPTPAAPPETGAILLPALAAPTNLRPPNTDGFNADSLPLLRWDPVPGMTEDDFYYVRVQFVLTSGEQGFVDGEVTETRFVVPRWVFDVASPPDRYSYWTVQVRRRLPSGQVIELSPPSQTGVFYWR